MSNQVSIKELQYQREGYHMKANLQNWKVEQLIIKASVEFTNRIKPHETLFTIDCFNIYLQALADSIATSEQDVAFLLPSIEQIKTKVFGRLP